MKTLLLLIGIGATTAFAQQLDPITDLSAEINKTSGLIQLQDRIITMNDAGGDSALFEFDLATGSVLRTVQIDKANNRDWESITSDQNFIYIGDFGNDLLQRNQFSVYQISLVEYLSSTIVEPQVIRFQYPNCTNNADAFVAIDDSLYIFAHSDFGAFTYVYSIPNTPGNYTAHLVDSLQIFGHITDAAMTSADALILTALTSNGDFVAVTMDYGVACGHTFHISSQQIVSVPSSYSGQIEAICMFASGQIYVTSEISTSGTSALFELEGFGTAALVENNALDFNVSPNPANDFVNIKLSEIAKVSISSISGGLVWESRNAITNYTVNTSEWESGVYIVSIRNKNGQKTAKLLLN